MHIEKHWPLYLLLGCCLVAVAGAQGPAQNRKQDASLKDLSWMVGSWIERKQGVETEEYWTDAKGGLMLGVNRTVRESGKNSFEFLRIAETPGGVSYFASPDGRPPVEFPLVERVGKKVVFENPKQAFPQRIIYWQDGEGNLRARIEGQKGGKNISAEWTWEKAK
jgi:hypothetical protein